VTISQYSQVRCEERKPRFLQMLCFASLPAQWINSPVKFLDSSRSSRLCLSSRCGAPFKSSIRRSALISLFHPLRISSVRVAIPPNVLFGRRSGGRNGSFLAPRAAWIPGKPAESAWWSPWLVATWRQSRIARIVRGGNFEGWRIELGRILLTRLGETWGECGECRVSNFVP
jgi:hypothetical protein